MRVAAKKRTAIVRRNKTHAIVRHEPVTLPEAIEKALIVGDLAPLTVEQRLDYYKKVCMSLGLNPLTRPFDYIAYNGKLTLYARRDCTDQLRKIHAVSVMNMKRDTSEPGMCIVEVEVKNKDGRSDTGTGVVFTGGLKGLDLANAIMKAETKAKRRATLSVCGLGFLDQSELDGISEYNEITPGGRVIVEQGSVDAAQKVAQRKIAEHEEGKPIESHPEAPAQETILITTLEDGRVALSGANGLQIVKAEIGPELLAELDIKKNQKTKITHMPASKVFEFIDRAAKFNVIAKLADASVENKEPEQGRLL